MRISIRDLFWLITAIAMLLGGVRIGYSLHERKMKPLKDELKAQEICHQLYKQLWIEEAESQYNWRRKNDPSSHY